MPTLSLVIRAPPGEEELAKKRKRDDDEEEENEDDVVGGSGVRDCDIKQDDGGGSNERAAKKAKTEGDGEEKKESADVKRKRRSVSSVSDDAKQAATEDCDTKQGGATKKKKKKAKKEKDPNAPKGPISSYLFFGTAIRPGLQALGIAGSGPEVGERWRALTAEEKRPYDVMAAADRQRYDREMVAYYANLATAGAGEITPTSNNDVVDGGGKQVAGTTKKDKKKAKRGPKKRDADAPKGMCTSYAFFQKEMHLKTKVENPGLTGVEVTQTIARWWKAMTEEQQKPYVHMQVKDKRRFDNRMAVCNANLEQAAEVEKMEDDDEYDEKSGWNAMTEEQQKPYVQIMQVEDKKRFDEQMANYTASLQPPVDRRTNDVGDGGMDSETRHTLLYGAAARGANFSIIAAKQKAGDQKQCKSTVNASVSSAKDDEDDDKVQCAICNGMIKVYEDEAEFCQNAKDCEASFHKSCLVKYDLEPMFEDLALTKKCIKCCTLKPEDEVDMDDTLSGMNFVVDTKRDADEKTIRAFGGTWSREVNPEKATWYVVNGTQTRIKVDKALEHDIPFIGPANIRLLALVKTTADQVNSLPSILPRIDFAVTPVPSTRKSVRGRAVVSKPAAKRPTKKVAVTCILAPNEAAGEMDDSSARALAVAIAGKKKAARAASKESTVEENKENHANASIVGEKDGGGSINNESKKGMFAGLSKSMMAAKSKGESLVKNASSAFRGKKKAAKPSTVCRREKGTSSNKICAELEAMAGTVAAKLPLWQKIKGSAKAKEDDDSSTASSSSSDDSIWKTGLPSSKQEKGDGDRKAGGATMKSATEKADAVCEDEVEDCGGDWQPEGEGDESFEDANLSVSKAEDAKTANAKNGAREEEKERTKTRDVESPASDSAKVVASKFNDDETPVKANTSNKVGNKKQPPPAFDAAVDQIAEAANPTTLIRSTRMKLVPVTKPECQAALRDRGITYSEPDYLVAGGTDEYNVARDDITLEVKWTTGANGSIQLVSNPNQPSKATLGRNMTTGIEWSAISRKLCEVSLKHGLLQKSTSIPTAFLTMMKPAQDHAVCLDGHEVNQPVGKRTVLKNGDILSLYGPTGFAYRVEISRDGEEPLDPIRLFS